MSINSTMAFASILAMTCLAVQPAFAQETQAANVYQLAVDNKERSDADVARDAQRRPAEVMEFLGIKQGMTVLDMFSGGGYYTELLSHVVGPHGSVTAQSNLAYLGFSGEESAARYGDNRLPNTSVLMAENNELILETDTYDAVTMILAYHDIYYQDAENGWALIDGPVLLAQLYKGMKPGAILGIVDHAAAPGSPSETGGTTHRIDRGLVISEVEAAGFVLDSESYVLRNSHDDYEKSVFDPELRGKTDRFILKFRKPG
jgi:predicted methyltransferase